MSGSNIPKCTPPVCLSLISADVLCLLLRPHNLLRSASPRPPASSCLILYPSDYKMLLLASCVLRLASCSLLLAPSPLRLLSSLHERLLSVCSTTGVLAGG